MIPTDRVDTVNRAVYRTFGPTTIEEIRTLPNGLSSDLAFRLVIKGSAYLLRIMTRIDESMNPERIFATMNAVSEAGLTPKVRYTNAEDAIAISELVEGVPLPATEALLKVPRLVRRLHALPAFSKAFNYVTAHNGFIWRFRNAGILSRKEIEEVFPRYERLCAVYPRIDSDVVSCHNDLKPDNILYDGRRIWLMGWQAALANDRYFDLAVAANYLLNSHEDESIYLEQYFGEQASEHQQARFLLMRQVLHMFSAAIYLMIGSKGKSPTEGRDLPSFGAIHRKLWAGEANLTTDDAKIDYGLVNWNQLLNDLRSQRFHESLKIVHDQHKSQDVVRLLPIPQ